MTKTVFDLQLGERFVWLIGKKRDVENGTFQLVSWTNDDQIAIVQRVKEDGSLNEQEENFNPYAYVRATN